MSEEKSKKSKWKHKFRGLKRKESREEFENWTEDDFISHIFELREELNAQKEKSEVAKSAPLAKESPKNAPKGLKLEDFSVDWAYSDKFAFLLRLENRPLSSKEIHNHLMKLDKGYRLYGNPKQYLSSYLWSVTKTGRILAMKIPGFTEKLFALPEWGHKDRVLKKFKDGLSGF